MASLTNGKDITLNIFVRAYRRSSHSDRGKTEMLTENLVSVPFCPTQIPYWPGIKPKPTRRIGRPIR
jgi:hypothetical protein